MVNFWATWCAPCREEMPEFIKAQTEYGPKGLQFVGIAVDQPDKVEQFAKEIGLNYPTLVGGFGAMELSKTLGNNLMALPFTVVVDRKGAIVHTQLGELKPDKLTVDHHANCCEFCSNAGQLARQFAANSGLVAAPPKSRCKGTTK